MDDVDVVVVGGGPAGTMLACELRLAGVRTLVVERMTEPFGHAKALGLHARTIEEFELRGAHEDLLDGAPKLRGGHFASLPSPLVYEVLDSRHPYGLYRTQVEVEELLTARAGRLGAEIRRGHELVRLEQDDTGVTAGIRGPDGEYQIRSRYLVGCDGGRSTTRKLAGIEFPGQEPSLAVLLADAKFSGELPVGEGMGPLRPYGVVRPEKRAWFSAVPLFEPGLHRVMVFWYGRTFPDRRAPVTEQEMRAALVDIAGSDFGLCDIEWLTRLTDSSRQAEQYRRGRVFLAGDAAHVTFPAGGPGMNMGLQDSMNLGWKLGAAVHGWGGDTLLDSYHSERHPVGELVLRNTRLQVVLLDPDPNLRALRDTFTDLLRMPQVNRYFAGLGVALDIEYDLPGAHPMIGRRMPDVPLVTPESRRYLSEYFHCGHGVLVMLGRAAGASDVATAWKDRVDVLTGTAAEPDDRLANAFLVRPDGYVCWAGDPVAEAAELRAALETWFGAPLR
ncbi:FAD-dependent monooxygenase [Actinoplanes palleronii]|uniref:FAD-binding domain-containing protein n=1 Tax=Actinoplanes palleronii TaxID=113570 RepID=A0ABQ4B180_9ACTN|nr:FAD-dependent monooxygenase [Actinoplanes palleronii]GIE64415.1 hypothetical protein Apa02nite_005230 [Actinoplanes palleronii]